MISDGNSTDSILSYNFHIWSSSAEFRFRLYACVLRMIGGLVDWLIDLAMFDAITTDLTRKMIPKKTWSRCIAIECKKHGTSGQKTYILRPSDRWRAGLVQMKNARSDTWLNRTMFMIYDTDKSFGFHNVCCFHFDRKDGIILRLSFRPTTLPFKELPFITCHYPEKADLIKPVSTSIIQNQTGSQ